MFDFIEKHLLWIVPSHMSLAQYLTFVIDITFFFSFITQSSINFPYHNFIKKTFQNLFIDQFLFQITLLILLFHIIFLIAKKCNQNTFYFSILISKLTDLYFLYLSGFMLYVITFLNSSDNLSDKWTYIIYMHVAMVYFAILLEKMFNNKEYKEKELFHKKKREYMDYTLRKYENKSIDEIEKRTALLNLYKITDEMYSKGVCLDEDEIMKKNTKDSAERIKNLHKQH